MAFDADVVLHPSVIPSVRTDAPQTVSSAVRCDLVAERSAVRRGIARPGPAGSDAGTRPAARRSVSSRATACARANADRPDTSFTKTAALLRSYANGFVVVSQSVTYSAARARRAGDSPSCGTASRPTRRLRRSRSRLQRPEKSRAVSAGYPSPPSYSERAAGDPRQCGRGVGTRPWGRERAAGQRPASARSTAAR